MACRFPFRPAAAQKTDDATFVKTTNKEVAAKYGLAEPGFAVARNFPEFGLEVVQAADHDAFESEKDLDEQLVDFVKEEKIPAYIEFTSQSSNSIFGSGIHHQVRGAGRVGGGRGVWWAVGVSGGGGGCAGDGRPLVAGWRVGV